MLTYTDRLQATRRPQNRDVLHKQAGHLAVEFIFICYFMEIEHILFAWEVGAGLLVLPLPALFQIIPKVPPHLSRTGAPPAPGATLQVLSPVSHSQPHTFGRSALLTFGRLEMCVSLSGA